MTTSSSKDVRLVAADLVTDARLEDVEDDAFHHSEIAGRLAELVATTRTPCNVALYGPWGSGKSSFFHLLSEEISRQGVSAAVVRYDAWKFGGHALKRNFISNAADQLGIDTSGSQRSRSDFHGGLHQSRSSVELRPENIWRGGTLSSVLLYAALAGLLAVLFSLAWAGVVAWASDSTYSSAFKNALQPIGTAMLTAAGAVGLGVKIFETANVTVDRTAPSEDDEFDELFGRLVAEGKKRSRKKTLVFFIDELDRCSKSDVVTTLTSLRTFLDQRDCVFIVAADREVLEEALSALEQETPVRADEPYYSSASAFLDKIFQYQFALPPLRSGRLTGFARNLVIDNRTGLWADLRSINDGRALDEVLYTLIPAHVRSPRRVKVLLNSFATNVRVAEARTVDWRARALEVAKLTVLQVEFPALAADLHLEPGLPTLLVSPPPQPTQRQQMLLGRHGPPPAHLDADAERTSSSSEAADAEGTSSSSEAADAGEEARLNGATPPDRLLAGAKSAQLRRRQYDDLIRYLQSRELAPDPARDLIYLEVAGATVGIDDPELGSLIEDTAATDPDAAVSGVAGRTEAELVAVAKALGRQSENEFGPEQQNMIRALTGVAARIDLAVLRGGVGDLPQQLRSYAHAQDGFEPEMFAGVLKIGVAVGTDGDDLLKYVRGPEFYDDVGNVEIAVEALRYLDTETAQEVAEGVGRLALERPDITLSILRSESAAVVRQFLRDAEDYFVEAFEQPPPPDKPPEQNAGTPGKPAPAPEPEKTPPAPDATEFLQDAFTVLLERGQPFGEIAVTFATAVLKRREPKGAYRSAYRLASEIAEAAPDATTSDEFVLAGFAWAVPTGWSHWLPLLSSGSNATGAAEQAGRRILLSAWKQNDKYTDIARDQAAASLRAVVRGRTSADAIGDEGWDPVLAELRDEVDLTEDDAVAARKLLFDLTATGIELDADDGLTGNLVEALAAGLAASTPISGLNDDVAANLVELLGHVPDRALPGVKTIWLGAITDELAINPHYCRVELALAKQLATRTDDPVDIRVEAADHVLGSPFAGEALSDWLATGPSAEAGVDVLRRLTSSSAVRTLRPALAEWARKLTEKERTDATKALLDEQDECLTPVVTAVVSKGVDLAYLARDLADAMASATAKPARQRVIGVAELLQLRSYEETRPLAERAMSMLQSNDSKSANEDAAQLLSVIGGSHQMKGKLQQIVRELEDKDGLSPRARRFLEHAGYHVGRKRKRNFLKTFGLGE